MSWPADRGWGRSRPRATQKTCTRCGVLKPIEAFRLVRDRKGAFRKSHCRACEARRTAEWKAERRVSK